MISFLFYACTERLDNLYQTIRILQQRETKFWQKEIIVVFQDNVVHIEGVKTVGLNLKSYHKPKQCNIGVKLAKYPVVALLDSDRILPQDYFYQVCREIKRNQFITCTHLHTCKKPYTDEEILQDKFEFDVEERSQINEIRFKNLFSGNTVFYKDQYLSMGGMDENYIGYGFADNDMTQKVVTSNMEVKFINLAEIHLWHEKSIMYQGRKNFDFRIISAINMLYYCKKWSAYTETTDHFCREILQELEKFDKQLQIKFLHMYRKSFQI